MKLYKILTAASLSIALVFPAACSNKKGDEDLFTSRRVKFENDKSIVVSDKAPQFRMLRAGEGTDLIARANSGDEIAQDELVRRHFYLLCSSYSKYNLDKWTSLKKANYDDQFAFFAMYMPKKYQKMFCPDFVHNLNQRANEGYPEAAYVVGLTYLGCYAGNVLRMSSPILDKHCQEDHVTSVLDNLSLTKAAKQGLMMAKFVNVILLKFSIDQLSDQNNDELRAKRKSIFAMIEKIALSGMAAAKNELGMLYEQGYGVNQDYGKAREMYLAAANQSCSHGLHNLAKMLLSGAGGKVDPGKAIPYLKQAVDLGLCEAQTALGDAYVLGHGVPQTDVNKALELFGLAASQSEDVAISRLQVMAKKGNALACYTYGQLLLYGTGTKMDVKSARKYLKVAAAKDFPKAHCLLGDMYFSGAKVSKDFMQAFIHYGNAALLDDSDAQLKLAQMFESGMPVEKNTLKAILWYREALKLGNTIAFERLERLATDGHLKAFNILVRYLLDKNQHAKAAAWFDKFKPTKHAGAFYRQGFLYLHGLGVKKDHVKAFALFKEAAEMGKPKDLCNLAYMYKNGYGTPVNLRKARELYKAGADQGDGLSQTFLDQLESVGPIELIPIDEAQSRGFIAPEDQDVFNILKSMNFDLHLIKQTKRGE